MSNRRVKSSFSKKQFLKIIIYFISNKGVKTKILKFDKLTGETSLKLTEYISKVLTHYDVLKKGIAYGL